MNQTAALTAAFVMTLLTLGCSDSSDERTPLAAVTTMSFFVTSSGSGAEGGNLGGLDGADATCQGFGEGAGQGQRTWRAFLSTAEADARDRIGQGPWHNAVGVQIAPTLQELLSVGVAADGEGMDPDSDAKRALLLDETGARVSASPLQHDILTGTAPDGTFSGEDCKGWTSSAAEDVGHIGHSDSRGPQGDNRSLGWISAHDSDGCSEALLIQTAGSGRLYCFAAD